MAQNSDQPGTVLSLLAHPDDAEILCGGTLVRLADLGWEVHLATLTAGDCGTMTESPEAISRRRTEEAHQAAAKIGGTYHSLGERDFYVVYDKPTVRKVIDLCRQVAPSLVFTHAEKDYIMDHEVVHQLARAGTFCYAAPNSTDIPLQEGSAIPRLYYCDPLEGLDPYGRQVQPTTYVDVTDPLERKLEMLACHRSQRQWLRAHHGMDEYLEAAKRHAAHRGHQHGTDYAEAFVQHRGHGYPGEDLLRRLFEGEGLRG